MATPYIYKRDENGHLMCGHDKCSFKPKSTPTHPNGNPSTMHYHMKKHAGDFAHVCSVCKHGFLHALTLQTHMAARHPEIRQQTTVEVYKCPLDNCEFESLTKANRRIHFLRKHCREQVSNYQTEIIVDNKKVIQCSCCSEQFKSGTAFHYHIGSCMISKGIEVHELLESVC